MPIRLVPACRAEIEIVEWIETKGYTVRIEEDVDTGLWKARIEHCQEVSTKGARDPLEALQRLAMKISGTRIGVNGCQVLVPTLKCSSLTFQNEACDACGKIHSLTECKMGKREE